VSNLWQREILRVTLMKRALPRQQRVARVCQRRCGTSRGDGECYDAGADVVMTSLPVAGSDQTPEAVV